MQALRTNDNQLMRYMGELMPKSMTEYETTFLTEDNGFFKRALKKQSTSIVGTVPIRDRHEVLIVIRGMVERRIISEGILFQLGRFDYATSEDHDIDLTPYGAEDRGVSRIHAHLYLENNRIFIVDLDSTNGTFLRGERLEPNVPKLLRTGDEILLGRLGMQIMFR